MPKHSIFIKIYLCFLIATLLVIAAQISLDQLTRPMSSARPQPADHLIHTLAPVLTVYGHTALEYHLLGNHDALAKTTDQLKRLSGIDAYLIDRTGNDVSHRSLSREITSIALRVKETDKMELSSSKRKVLLAFPVKDEKGNYYCVVGEVSPAALGSITPPPPGPPPPPFLLGPGPPPPPSTLLALLRLFITLLISGIVCYSFAHYLTVPVIKLRDATRRFAGGELTVRIGKNTGKWKDELSELADDFDGMAERIESLLTQQRQLTRGISHELRSPLARLIIAVELVRRQTGEEAIPALDRIEKEAMLLNEMIGQMLAITRFESDIETIQMAPVDLAKLLEEIADDANFEAHARNCIVQFTGVTACIVSGNEEWLRRAIENVVRNAVRYTHDNTTVDIKLTQIVHDSKSHAEISVHDHGIGVPETHLPHLFRPFYRVSNARERQTGGAGLGLAITERAVGLHHGSVTASNAPDSGLVVVIHLPL